MNDYSFFSKRVLLHSIFLLFILSGCSKDDEPDEFLAFYADADTGVTAEELEGIWSVYEVEFEGKKTQVPGNSSECPRDFFIFSGSKNYTEYTFSDSYGCPPTVGSINYELKNGIVTLGNSIQELVITTITDQKLVFRTRFDVDDDGAEETFLFTAYPYEPPAEIDIYSETFQHDLLAPYYDQIRFSWQPYIGYNQFDRYEVYRSAQGCGKENAELIATITNRDQKSFIDENPPAGEELCYFFKLFTAEGLLAESQVYEVDPDYLDVASIQMEKPQIENLSVKLRWNKYHGLYFSHYEITVRNFEAGYGYGYQEEAIAKINNINTTTFTDEDMPYFSNPVYTIYVHNIFGKKSVGAVQQSNSWTVDVTRPEILPYKLINQYAVDPVENILYLNGASTESNQQKLQRYNYVTNTFEASADRQPEGHTSLEMKVISSSYGKEILYPQGSDLFVYDAANLKFKYSLKTENSIYFNDFVYLGSHLWAVTDDDQIYICSRDGENLKILDQQVHFTAHQGSGLYRIIPLKDNQIVVGHYQEPLARKFRIASNGQLQEGTTVSAIIKSPWRNKTVYSAAQNYVADLWDRNIYSGSDLNLIKSFGEPVHPTSLSSNGKLVLGSVNDPQWTIQENSPHQKKAVAYDLSTGQTTTYEANGYPLFVFENHLGQIISISSGLKRAGLDENTPSPDIFVEKL